MLGPAAERLLRSALVQIDLTDEQAELLREILDGAYRDLRYEIVDTDNAEYKAGLRTRAAAMRVLLDTVGGPLPNP
jgi:hypothetical protein